MQLLRQTAPASNSSAGFSHPWEWYTWSEEFLGVVSAWAECADALEDPEMIHVSGGVEYDYTFSLPLESLPHEYPRHSLVEVAHSARNLKLPRNIVLLTDLFSDKLDGVRFHRLLSCIRSAIVDVAGGDQWAALHAPPKPVGPTIGEFPLHADLYVPWMLLNVFDDVPDDESGASLFLSIDELREAIELVADIIPIDTRAGIERCLRRIRATDGFQELYSSLYGQGSGLVRQPNDWTAALRSEMTARCSSVKFERGQGYLLDDRSWLHGRTAPTHGVPPNRIHRLVFKNVL